MPLVREGITFYPLAEVVQEAAGVSQTDDLNTARAKLASLAADAAERGRIVRLVPVSCPGMSRYERKGVVPAVARVRERLAELRDR